MSLTKADIRRIADLGRIEISEEQILVMQDELNAIFKMIERISRVDTQNVMPMPNPHDGVQRLREDLVTEANHRDENMKNAPEKEQGCFLVPQVIE